jgi:hypothetical protein
MVPHFTPRYLLACLIRRRYSNQSGQVWRRVGKFARRDPPRPLDVPKRRLIRGVA